MTNNNRKVHTPGATLLRWMACLLISYVLFPTSTVHGQGCVAVSGGGQCPLNHSMGHPMGTDAEGSYFSAGDWQVALGYRWLHSDRHFRGDVEQTHRQKEGTEVVNKSNFMDLSFLYAFSSQWSVALTFPFVYSERSSLYEHPGTGRHTTKASGLGDIRLSAYYWLLDPKDMPKGNLSLGLGPKFPTGDCDAQDSFYTADGVVHNAVDQSIQPGDGGFGFTTEVFGFLELFPRGYGYLQGYYLFNPETSNGTSTTTGRPRSNPYEQEMSIADQYLGRLGINYALAPDWGLSVGLGGRIDGVPVRDALGGSNGFRRPGYAVSIEPGLYVTREKWSFSLTVPIAVYRNRLQSVPDKQWTKSSGEYHHGDAAFADYLITASFSRTF
jgi:hypothetical protein